MIAALYVMKDGPYFGLPDVDPWDEGRDARLYRGPHPVVAHPPCHLWVNLAAVNWKRYGRHLPAWYPGGSDGACFVHACYALQRWGGVLEHPAFSHAWQQYGLPRPERDRWVCDKWGQWSCEVWQSAYGHQARKRTWLLYMGKRPPFDMDWSREPGTHQIGWFDRNKPTLSKKAANATPPAFRDELIRLARYAA